MKKFQSILNLKFKILNSPRSGAGFTLIEILIAVTILALLMSLSFAGYSKLNQRQKLVAAGENLKNLLRDAQSRAFNGEVDCSVCTCSLGGPASLIGWYADFTTKDIYGKCQDNSTFGNKLFNLSDEIVVAVTPNVNSLLFRYGPPSTDNNATICLNIEGEANSYYVIKVNRAGSVSDLGDIQISCP